MATVTRSRKTVKFSCEFVSITVRINDHRYAVDPIDPGEDGSKAYRLSKHSGDHAVYDVVRQHDGIVACDCPSYETTHRGNGYGMCKHARALVELGLMPAPIAPAVEAPAPEPAPEPEPLALEHPPVDLPGVGETFHEIPEAPAPVDPWDAEAPAELWGPETDDHLWNLADDGPTAEDLEDYREWSAGVDAREYLDRSATVTLDDLAEHVAAHFRTWGNGAGDLFARELETLAVKLRLVAAVTPEEYEARIGVEEEAIRDQWIAIGYDRATEGCGERDACLGSYGHPA